MIVTGQRGVSVQNSTSAFIIKYDQTKRIDLRVLYSTYLNNPSPKRYPLNINNSHPPPNIQLHLTLAIPTYVRRGEPTSTMSQPFQRVNRSHHEDLKVSIQIKSLSPDSY